MVLIADSDAMNIAHESTLLPAATLEQSRSSRKEHYTKCICPGVLSWAEIKNAFVG